MFGFRNGFRGVVPAILATLTCAPIANGDIAVIDFNGLAGPHNLFSDSYSEDGYTLASLSNGLAAEVNGFQPNGLFLRGTNASPQIVRLTHSSNDSFDLLSIAIGDNSTAGATMFTGSNGASRLVIDSDLGLELNFGAEWANLMWVQITVSNAASGAPGQFTADNIAVQTVPAPAVSLLVMGVTAGRLGRRRMT